MLDYRTFLQESASILAGSSDFNKVQEMVAVMEDTISPVAVRHTEQLFQSVINKGHIDFGDIATSKGNIRNYSGYSSMKETLQLLQQMASQEKADSVFDCVGTVLTAIQNLESLINEYEDGFRRKVEYVMLEYNTITYCCVEATTALLCEFVEYIKRPGDSKIEIELKNTKYRANLFYLEQLRMINKLNASPDYRKFLQEMNAKGQENFTGAAMVGFVATMILAASIVPIIRKLIFTFYDIRRRLAYNMMLQAGFLELHKTCIEANQEFTPEKKKKILEKQEKIRVLLLKGADKIRIQNTQAQRAGAQAIKKENQLMTFDKTKENIDNNAFSLL